MNCDVKSTAQTSSFTPESQRSNATLPMNGFTLLEVLIAVAIMSGIIAIIYQSFFIASRNVEQAETIRDSSDMARTLVAKIADDVSNAYYNQLMNRAAIVTIFNGKKEQADPTDEKRRLDSITLTTLTNWRQLIIPTGMS